MTLSATIILPILPVPLVLARQTGEAWTRPFVAVFEPFNETDGQTISNIRYVTSQDNLVGIIVKSESLHERTETIFNDTAMHTVHNVEGQTFQGIYGVTCTDANGLQYLYLGYGKTISAQGFEITAMDQPVSACLYKEAAEFRISTSGPVQIKTPNQSHTVEACHAQSLAP